MHDDDLARKYGGFISFQTDADPISIEKYGESEDQDFERLLNVHIQPTSKVVDLGCGAGQFTCEVVGHAGQLWGIDQEQDVITAATERANTKGLSQAHFLCGDKNDPHILAEIPNDIDVIYSRRGPNLDEALAKKLKVGSVFLQLQVAEFDGYPLREIMGRREYSPYHFHNDHDLMVHYAYLHMQPISIKSYFFDVYFRNVDHLEKFLIEIPANLTDWRMAMLPYDPHRDRAALELYARYQTTKDGVRLQRHRRVMAFRKITLQYPTQNQ